MIIKKVEIPGWMVGDQKRFWMDDGRWNLLLPKSTFPVCPQ